MSDVQRAIFEEENRYRPINRFPIPGFTWPKPSFAQKRAIVRRRQEWAREKAEMEARGYRLHETDWEIHRGGRVGEVILDAKISGDGKYVWTKIGPRP